MIIVDDRIGSADLAGPLRKMGVAVEVTRLEFGDLTFTGRGSKDYPVQVGIELKKVPDLLQSLRDGRLTGHQLPGMMDPNKGLYDYGWLLVEGTTCLDPQTGILLECNRYKNPLRGKWTYAELQKRLLSLEQQFNVRTVWCADRTHTLRWIICLYRWWTDQAMDSHGSATATHTPRVMGWLTVSPFREAVMKWPHIGPKLSQTVEATFGTLQRAANASVDEWAAIQVGDARTGTSRRLGLKCAEDIVRFLHG